MFKEEVYQQFLVLAFELWEQRANTYVLLSVQQDGWEKAPENLHTVALLCRKRRNKKQECGRMV